MHDSLEEDIGKIREKLKSILDVDIEKIEKNIESEATLELLTDKIKESISRIKMGKRALLDSIFYELAKGIISDLERS
ncbi:hypothetical protein DRJ17_05475 [Candidatus Woesearchaeota archaeon]|nr:MAG: hypothetical protein DRJ17_05475 [Candidatus Woesearchaeota archaeon]